MFPSNFVEEIAERESEDGKTKLLESFLENINNQLNVNGRGEDQPWHHKCLQSLKHNVYVVRWDFQVAQYICGQVDGKKVYEKWNEMKL